jgi:hypothetical protein
MACGYSPCGYSIPVPAYTSSGCNPCGGVGWGYNGYGYSGQGYVGDARLADPEQQYYYVNQGPTYTGPGAWAPARVYQEETASGYHYGYRHHGYAPRVSYYHHRPMGYHHGYAPAYHYGHRVLRRYY